MCLLQLAYVRLCCGDFVSVLSSVDECIGLLSKLSHTPENEKLKQRAGLYACEVFVIEINFLNLKFFQIRMCSQACCKLDLPSKALVYLAHQSTSTQDNTSARVQFTSISPSSAVEHALLKAAFHTNMACVQAAQVHLRVIHCCSGNIILEWFAGAIFSCVCKRKACTESSPLLFSSFANINLPSTENRSNNSKSRFLHCLLCDPWPDALHVSLHLFF